MSQENIIQIQYCCQYLKEAIENQNGVHITERKKEKEIAPFYMDVETDDGLLPCFLKFCPECGSKLSKYRW